MSKKVLKEKPKKRQQKKNQKKASFNLDDLGVEKHKVDANIEDKWWNNVLDTFDLDSLGSEDDVIKRKDGEDSEDGENLDHTPPIDTGDGEDGDDSDKKEKENESLVKQYNMKLDDIDPSIPYTTTKLYNHLNNVYKRKKNISSRDVEDFLTTAQKEHEKVVGEYEEAKAKIEDYKSITSGDKFEDWFKTTFKFLYTKSGIAKAKKRQRDRTGSTAKELLGRLDKTVVNSYKDIEIINKLVDIFKNGSDKISSETLYKFSERNPDVYKAIYNGFKDFKFKPENIKQESLTESIKSDIRKMWVVKKPSKKGMEVDDLLSHSSFDNMYTMYGEGVTSDDIYGVYFDKTKARNIAKRINNKYNKKSEPIEPSEEIIEEARKKRKKKKKKTTKRKKRKSTKINTRRRPRGGLYTDYTYIPKMTDDPGPGAGGGDGGGGGE